MASPYATSDRPEIHHLVPAGAGRILDVGCNDGGFGAWLLRDVPGREIWGVEPNAVQADIASRIFKGVVIGHYPEALDEIEGDFDCVTFNHVLEHMADPWGALARTRDRLVIGGCVIAVIPNIRYISAVADLVLRGRWEYTDVGLLDRTHLRFFTRASVISLFEGSGLEVSELKPVNGLGSVSHPIVSRALSRLLGDFTFGAFAVRALRAN